MKRIRIIGRRCPKIQLCPTCGHMRVNHPGANYFLCPVPIAVSAAIRAFALENGKRWKSKLIELWASGRDDGYLRQARNLIGPFRIYKIAVSLPKLVCEGPLK